MAKLLKVARDIDADKHLARLLSHNALGDCSKPAIDFWQAMSDSMGADPGASTFFDVPTWKSRTRALAVASMQQLVDAKDVRLDVSSAKGEPWLKNLVTSLDSLGKHDDPDDSAKVENDNDFHDNEVDDASMTESDSAETDDAALWEEAVDKTFVELQEYCDIFVLDNIPRQARETMFKLMMTSLRKNFEHISTSVEEEEEDDDENE